MGTGTKLTLRALLPLLLAAAVTACEETRWPKMVTNGNKYLYSHYGEYITLICSSDNAENFTITNDGARLQFETINATSIMLSVRPNIGIHMYSCTDGNHCQVFLNLTVKPKITVESPDAYHTYLNHYFVPSGKKYEIFCSGHNVESLGLTTRDFIFTEEINTEVLNTTTMMHKGVASRPKEWTYECSCHPFQSQLIIHVDRYPDARDFQCFLHFHKKSRKLECKWDTTSSGNYFKLFYLNSRRVETLICGYNSGEITRVCKSEIDDINKLHLVLQCCNMYICNNETYSMNVASIAKLEPPNFKLLSVSSRAIVVTWTNSLQDKYDYYKNCDFKVEYRLHFTEWKPASISVWRCVLFNCSFQVDLPCPSTHYELRIYVRHKEAVEDR